jgi:phospholipase/lecithinase/hemolysin
MEDFILAHKLKFLAAALATAGLLVACGGGGGADTTPKAQVTSVKVMGDSLADSGTFGYKFTVQGNDPTTGKPYQVWPERIAGLYNTSLCPHYAPTSETTFVTGNAGCTNYAIGGAQINYVDPNTGQVVNSAISVLQQIKDAGAAGVSSNDLILIDGGSNDAAELMTVVLTFQAAAAKAAATGAPQDLQAAQAAQQLLQAFLGSKIDPATLGNLLAQGQPGLVQAGGLYMQTLAKNLASTIQSELLAKGATRVALLNVPAIGLTPRFKAVLAQIAQAQGATASAQAAALLDGWVQAFNGALKAAVGSESRIALVDFYTEFTVQISNPAQYKFTNVTVPVCLKIGTDDLSQCSADKLSANIPAGETSPDWWKSYVFANSFHPTPYGYQQLSQLVARSLAQKGWL